MQQWVTTHMQGQKVAELIHLTQLDLQLRNRVALYGAALLRNPFTHHTQALVANHCLAGRLPSRMERLGQPLTKPLRPMGGPVFFLPPLWGCHPRTLCPYPPLLPHPGVTCQTHRALALILRTHIPSTPTAFRGNSLCLIKYEYTWVPLGHLCVTTAMQRAWRQP